MEFTTLLYLTYSDRSWYDKMKWNSMKGNAAAVIFTSLENYEGINLECC